MDLTFPLAGFALFLICLAIGLNRYVERMKKQSKQTKSS